MVSVVSLPSSPPPGRRVMIPRAWRQIHSSLVLSVHQHRSWPTHEQNRGSLFVSPGPSLYSQPLRESGWHPWAANFQNNRGIFIDFFF